MSEQIILTLHRLVKRYPPDKVVLDGITLSFLHGAKIGVLGANGSGKSSLLRIMAGIDTRFDGDAQLAPGATVGMLEQEPQLDETRTVYENVEDGMRETRDLLDRFNAISAKLGEPLDADEMERTLAEMGEVQEKIDAVDGWNLERMLATAMDALRVPPGEAQVSTLSGGERRRVALCRLLLRAPDLLLLDEPTNHLDAESVLWLEQHLAEYRGTVVAVTHDRYFLDNVAGWILELDRGKGIPYRGNYSGWLEQKQARLAQEEKSESAHRRALAREMEWAGMSQKARQAKGKARLQRYEALLSEDANAQIDRLEIHIPAGGRLGDVVVEASGLSKGFGDKLLIEDLAFSLPPGGIVGVIGPNGAGKTTLFRMIAGQEQPDERSAAPRRHGRARLRRPVARGARRLEDGVGGDHRRRRPHAARQARRLVAPVRLELQLPRQRPAEARQGSLGRRAQPPPPRQAAAQRRQPAPPRRAHERPGRRHAARTRGRARALRGLRGGHQP